MFGRDSGDEHVLCPFNNTHVILAKSLNSHLVKCRKSHQHLKKVPCKFDRTHMVLKPELGHHLSVCPSRVYLDRDLQIRSGGGNTLMGNVNGPEIRPSYVENIEEDWDAEPSHAQTNALFSRRSEFEDEDVSITNFEAVPSAPTLSLPPRTEEDFCRAPFAPSKAVQLSAPVSAKPKGSSSTVYEYSFQQAAPGRGRCRRMPLATAEGLKIKMESKKQADGSDDLSKELSRDALQTRAAIKGNQNQDFSHMTMEELKKAKRKMEKKLKQILALETKVSKGAVLSSEEEAKLRKKTNFLKDRDQIDQYL